MNQKPILYGPDNPHPLSRLKTELVWEGKYDEYGNHRTVHVPTTPLPLQRIETIDEPHDREKALQPRPFDESTFHQKAYHDVTSGEGLFYITHFDEVCKLGEEETDSISGLPTQPNPHIATQPAPGLLA